MLNKLAKEIHKTACEKGWWDGDGKEFGEIIALIHSELSEALEEHRNGFGLTEIYYKKDKPEGIPIELADAIIRMLDYCGKMGLDLGIFYEREFLNTIPDQYRFVKTMSFGENINIFHNNLSVFSKHNQDSRYIWCVNIAAIFYFAKFNGFDIMEAIRIKMEYNRTREYRHGGKRI